MAEAAIIDGARKIGLETAGFGFDLRPGANPDDWEFTDTYAWPVDDGPSPITLMPALLKEEWATTQADSGIYARDRLEHYTQEVSGSWEQYARLHAKDWTFQPKQIGTSLTSSYSLEPGAGIGVHLFAHGPQLNTENVLEVHFGHTDPAKRYGLNLREDGQAYLYRGGLEGTTVEPLMKGWIVPNRWGSILHRWLKLFILPHGRNRILISSSAGRGFVWEDKRLSRGDEPLETAGAVLLGANPPNESLTGVTKWPTVTDRAPFMLRIPASKTVVQPRSLRSVLSGTLKTGGPAVTGGPAYSRQKTPIITSAGAFPVVGPSLTGIVADRRRAEDLAVGYSTPYDLPGGLKGVTPTVTFSRTDNGRRDEEYSPILYRIEPSEPPTETEKTGTGSDLTEGMIRFTHRHDKDGMTGSVRIRNAEDHSAYRRAFNIPFNWTQDDHEYVQAVLLEPKYEWDGADQFLEFALQDLWKILETTLLVSMGRLDGLGISEAVEKILLAAGFPADGSMWDIDPTPSTADGSALITLSKGEADDEPTNLPDVVRSAAEWLRYIRDEYTSGDVLPFQWIMDFAPVLDPDTGLFSTRFRFKDPAGISIAPVKTFYATHADAEALGGAPHTTSYLSVHQEYSEESIEPEANDVYVFGLGPDDKPIRAHLADQRSMDPTIPLASRPSNWLGEPRQYILRDTSLNTQAQVTGACGRLFKRLSKARARARFRAMWEPTVRLWDTVRLFYSSDPNDYEDWKVTAFDVEHYQDDDTIQADRLRPATYSVERWLS